MLTVTEEAEPRSRWDANEFCVLAATKVEHRRAREGHSRHREGYGRQCPLADTGGCELVMPADQTKVHLLSTQDRKVHVGRQAASCSLVGILFKLPNFVGKLSEQSWDGSSPNQSQKSKNPDKAIAQLFFSMERSIISVSWILRA